MQMVGVHLFDYICTVLKIYTKRSCFENRYQTKLAQTPIGKSLNCSKNNSYKLYTHIILKCRVDLESSLKYKQFVIST